MSSEKGRRFSHLRWKDRLKIERMLKEGHKVKEIAAALHVDSTTIYREIKRGKTVQRTTELIDREIYCPDVAENKYRANLAAKGPALKLGNDYKLAAYIEQKIVEERYSPEAVLLKNQGGAADLLRDALQVDAVFLHHQGRVPGRDE